MSFLGEIKRREVFQVAALYIVAAWVVIQVGDVVFEAWGISDQALRYLIVGTLLGFPIALVFAWMYDVTLHGIVRTPPAGFDETADLSLRRADYLVLLVLVIAASALIWTVADKTLKNPDQQDTWSKTVSIAANSIAVLPFRNLSNEPDNDYISDGLTYELASYLTHLPDLMVTASSSAFALKDRKLDVREIGKVLRVRYIVEGVVRKAGERLRIDVQLVDTDSGFRIWQDTLNLDVNDVLGLQSEVASQVVAEMQSVLGTTRTAAPKKYMSSIPEAYDLYLLGMHEFRAKLDKERVGDWVDRTIDYLERAIEADPEFALAHARLAFVHLVYLWSVRADKFDASMVTARRLVERALILNPNLDVAYTTLAQIYLNESDLDSREHALRRALEINPANSPALFSLGDLLWRDSRLNEAHDFIRAAAIRDPLNTKTVLLNADLDAKLGNYARAKAQLFQLIEDNPDAEPFDALAQLEQAYGHFDEAARWSYQSYRGNSDQVARAPWVSDAAVDLGAWELVDIDSWLGASEGFRPLQMITTRFLLLIATDRTTEAARELNDVLAAEVPPPGQPLKPRHIFLLSFGSFVNAVAGDYKGALAYFTRADEQQRVVMPLHQQIIALSTMSVVANQLGRHEVAKQYLDRAASQLQVIEEFGATKFPIYTFSRALWYAASGDDGQALDLLEDAVDQGYRGSMQLRIHIPLGRYQDNARFKRLLARVDADIAAQRARAFESGWLIEPAVPTED